MQLLAENSNTSSMFDQSSHITLIWAYAALIYLAVVVAESLSLTTVELLIVSLLLLTELEPTVVTL